MGKQGLFQLYLWSDGAGCEMHPCKWQATSAHSRHSELGIQSLARMEPPRAAGMNPSFLLTPDWSRVLPKHLGTGRAQGGTGHVSALAWIVPLKVILSSNA